MHDKGFPEKDAPQPYLDDDFGKELNFQIWSTKGARFCANRRLQAKQQWSTYALTALSTYLIVLNLMIVYGVLRPTAFSSTVVAFGSTALSILILIVGLLEGSRHYELRASNFHTCGLDLARLYRRLRLVRTGPEAKATREEIEELAAQYEKTLAAYDNHEPIDYLMFQTTKSYFALRWHQRGWISVRWYCETLVAYHVVVFGPVLLAVWFALWRD